MTDKRFYATGKRKCAIARVYMKEGSGLLTINKRNFDDYFTRDSLKMLIQQPLEMTGKKDKFDFFINVSGGGVAVRQAQSSTGSPRLCWNMIWHCARP